MELYITEISKYLITILLALYTVESFMAFRFQEEERRSGIYIRQNLLMFGVHFSCFMVICFETGKIEYLFFYIFQQILLFAIVMLFRMIYPKGNRLLINNMCMLLSIGFVILTRISYEKAIKQFFIITVSIAIGIFASVFDEPDQIFKESYLDLCGGWHLRARHCADARLRNAWFQDFLFCWRYYLSAFRICEGYICVFSGRRFI